MAPSRIPPRGPSLRIPAHPHVPLLKRRNTAAHWAPLRARRLATMFRSHSRTLPRGSRYFHRAGLLFPMVVSSATCEEGRLWEGGGDHGGVPEDQTPLTNPLLRM